MKLIPHIDTGTYRHNKHDQLYEVLGVAYQTEGGEPLVIYRPLYDSEFELFARPHAMFIEMVTIEGELVPRFEKVPGTP